MGPLAGVKIVEFTGIGPAPMAAMMLADMGATIIRIDRTGPADLGVPMPEKFEFTKRSRAVIGLDLKQPESIQLALAPDRRRRRLDRGVSSRGDGASGTGSGSLPEAQSKARRMAG